MTRRLLRPVWQLMAGVAGPAGVIVLPAAALALVAALMLLAA